MQKCQNSSGLQLLRCKNFAASPCCSFQAFSGFVFSLILAKTYNRLYWKRSSAAAFLLSSFCRTSRAEKHLDGNHGTQKRLDNLLKAARGQTAKQHVEKKFSRTWRFFERGIRQLLLVSPSGLKSFKVRPAKPQMSDQNVGFLEYDSDCRSLDSFILFQHDKQKLSTDI